MKHYKTSHGAYSSAFSPLLVNNPNHSSFGQNKLQPTSRHNPCPVCAKTNGNCRTIADGGVLCMTFPDGDGHPDYRYVKPSENGLWGVHYPRKDGDFDRQAWEKRKEERETRNREIERQRLEKCLDPDRRDAEIRGILSQLTLTDGARRYLENRSVPPEIIDRCRSVKRWQKLAQPAHVNLAGVSKLGNQLNNGWDGILEVVPDHLGRLIAMRLHDPDHKTTGNPKYVWLSSKKRGITPHLANGENPIGLFWPGGLASTAKPQRIGLCEGLEFKAPAAANRLEFPVIGFSGYQFLQSPETLKEIITNLNPDAQLVLIPDGGSVQDARISRSHGETLATLTNPVTVAWWGQFTKADGDIDEIAGDRLVEFISPEQFLSYCPQRPKSKVEQFADWITKQVKRVKPQGFGAPVIGGELFTGDRVDALIKQLEKNRYVLDASWTGDGKSHAIVPLAKALLHRLETLHPEQEIKIYLTSHSYRQPTVEALTAIQAMPTRHGDRYFPHGELEEAANCIRSRQFNQVAEKGYNPHQGGKHNPICHSCPAFNYCGTDPGMFRQQRRLALQHQIIRCHPSQIPAKGENQLTVVIWDEPAEEQPTKTINTNIGELDQEIAYHRRHSQLSSAQKNILDQIASLLEGLMADAPKLGLDTADVLNHSQELNQELLGELITLLEQRERDLFDIFPAPTLATFKDNQEVFAGLTAKETAKLKGQFRRSNQYAVGEATKITEEKLQELPSNGLIHLLRCLHGQASVQIQLFPQNLLLTIDRRHELAPIRDADYVIALDATNNGADFACLLNLAKDEVKVIKRKTEKPFQNLKVVQIVLPGWGSSRPSDKAMEKAIAVKDALFQAYGPMPVLTYKAQLETLLAEGQWYRDSRGSNQFEGQPQMLSCGLPLPNLGAIKAQFLATGGQIEDFEEHYHRRSQREVLQNFGRQRANRYPRQQFTHFIVTGDPQHNAIHDLSWVKKFGADYVCLHGFEITPHAGDRSQIARWHIVEAIRSGFTTGSAIAEKLGCSRRNVTDVLTNAGATLTKVTKTLLDTTELGSSSYKPPIRLGSHLEDLPPEILALLGIDLPEAIAEVVEIIQIVGWRSFAEDYLPTLPQRLRSTILATFWSFLDTGPPAPV
ncbi:slr6031 (plasmid) [Synechocystis sp. PCC 6803]|uniref:Slr6031 protein n=1 Tax=Synechocystis sp. (strain ATCC 27184 / PCC 6803 / Kazusa) TaxID=1111708 RepID=Q6YRX3_SYNY3|nr:MULTISPECIES: hypothetical protein [unclassified Synechocystis]AGF53740.1 hypothetical protein MYO_3320 [Synechocystis sp. PCC 6803]AVP91712.1 hypothetical protein C7I86_18265 [Synechocystis sp. IPPAS B-1465]MBD2620128.1 hypothetical protein [Synechocystis sp. FACHB-898]MBD2639311.1 hypothetical protein [Synechocystis sp. FACHB-908]MBD2662828.1 hypothetical protein [Synechocystis sp. FACHB-929]